MPKKEAVEGRVFYPSPRASTLGAYRVQDKAPFATSGPAPTYSRVPAGCYRTIPKGHSIYKS